MAAEEVASWAERAGQLQAELEDALAQTGADDPPPEEVAGPFLSRVQALLDEVEASDEPVDEATRQAFTALARTNDQLLQRCNAALDDLTQQRAQARQNSRALAGYGDDSRGPRYINDKG